MVEPAQDLAQGARDVEVEWQFDALDLRPVERWLAALPGRQPAPDLPTLTALAKPARRLVDRYLDTPDWRLARAGFVLRTRHHGRQEEATLKNSHPPGEGGLRVRLEVTEPLEGGDIKTLSTLGPVGRRVRAVAGTRPLRQVLEVRTRRRPFSLRVAGEEVAELALDDTVITGRAGERPVQLRRVEVEVSPDWVKALEPVVAELRVACGLQPATLSKFEAGLLGLGIPVPGPPELGPTTVTPDSTLGDLAYAIIRRHLAVLLAKEPGTRLGEDLEELHDMRVATRRLRAALGLFVEVLPIRARVLRSELGWIADMLGAVRDLDVQLQRMDETDEWTVAGAKDLPGLSPFAELRSLLMAERERARHHLLEALDSPRWERLTAGLSAMVQQGPSRRSPATRVKAALAAPGLVALPHDQAVKAARKAAKTGVPADFHRLRIRCKRLRYSLEFTADVYGERTARFTRQLAKLQDKLGLMQDAEVATGRLAALATQGEDALGGATIFAMGGVAERYRAEAAALLKTMPRRLKVLKGREWQGLSALMERRRDEALAAQPPPRALGAGPPPVGGATPGVIGPFADPRYARPAIPPMPPPAARFAGATPAMPAPSPAPAPAFPQTWPPALVPGPPPAQPLGSFPPAAPPANPAGRHNGSQNGDGLTGGHRPDESAEPGRDGPD
jgi:triphosphatase